MDSNRWTNTLPNSNRDSNNEAYLLDPNRWTNTIPKKKSNNFVNKFSLTIVLFVFGLVIVSAIKNKTRILEKEINNLHTSINKLKTDLHQSTLDHEVITSPENISQLAAEYMETELVTYKKSQIIWLNEERDLVQSKTITNKKNNKQKIEPSLIKIKITNKIAEKKIELAKLEELYSKPEKLPEELKLKVERKIAKAKTDLKQLYTDPKNSIDIKKIQQWGAIQVVKAFLGIPIVPGR
tara:strand:- start:246 stop:959 length:714 start_codon:yes stop_codon:yes gene_type:complete